MNTKVWANTNSNILGFHAFPEGAAMCNKRIRPNDGHTFLTAAQAKSMPQAYLCERCVTKLDALTAQAERKAQAPQVQTLPVSEAHTVADSQGRVIYLGNANTHKRPQGFPEVMHVQAQGRGMFALISEDGSTIKRFRASTRLYLMACPEDIDDVRAQAEAEGQRIADSVELGMVEVAAPVAAAEAPAVEAEAPKARVVREITDQDEKRAALASATYATPQDAENAAVAAQVDAPLVVVHVGDVEDQDAPQGEAPDVEDVYAAEDRAEAEAIERARTQAERLRNRAQLETPVVVVKACANFRDLAWHANTEAARRYWQRRCQEVAMIETVKAHAQANYDLGWDTVVECYTDAEILEVCRENGATLPLEAVDAFRSLTDVWAERQCGALVDGYGI